MTRGKLGAIFFDSNAALHRLPSGAISSNRKSLRSPLRRPRLRGRWLTRGVLICVLALLLGECGTDPAAAAPSQSEGPVLVFTGDILLAGRAGDLIAKEGPEAPFAGVHEILRRADLAVGNLECALATSGEAADKQFTFRGAPEAARALAAAGFDLVTLANNHSVDFGPRALLETMESLRRQNIRSVGAGADIAEARRSACFSFEPGPVKVAILAFSNMLPTSFYATAERPGTNPARLGAIAQEVAAARAEADIVIVLFHWGTELSPKPSPSQRLLAKAAVDAGADLVVGHHPHVLQGLERRGSALIAYSLGNFLFPSRERTRQTVILSYRPRRDGSARVQLIPCLIEGYRPRVAPERARRSILSAVAKLSRELGAELNPVDGSITLPPRVAPVDKPPPDS